MYYFEILLKNEKFIFFTEYESTMIKWTAIIIYARQLKE
jgi:hypothetical protein